MKTVINTESIKLIGLFEKITRARVKDFFDGETLIFVIEQGDIGKALGKNRFNVQKLKGMLKKNFRIIEFNENLLQFVINVFAPLKVHDIKEEEEIVIITPSDNKTRGYMIGRNAQNLRSYESIVKKYFNIKELKVI